MATIDETSSAVGVRWDLSVLLADVAAARAAMVDAAARAEELSHSAAGIAELDPAGLRALLDRASELSALRYLLDEEWGYAALRLLADASDLEARDLVTESEPFVTAARDALRAVELAAGAGTPSALAPEVGPYRFWLDHQASLAQRRLAPEAEQAFAARAPTAATAWGKLSQELLTTASVPFDAGAGERPHGVVELRLLRYHADRDVRRRAAETLRGVYEARLGVEAACLDAVVADRLTEDRLRGRPDPMEATLAVDGVPRAAVDGLLAAVEGRTDVLERWLERKRTALGAEGIEPFDRHAPVGDVPVVTWQDAVEACRTVVEEISKPLAPLARGVFEGGRVDAERRPGKDGGIFCAPFAGGGAFLFLSYLDTPTGALFLGHELGHAVHFERAVAAGVPWLALIEPGSAAFFEVPSTFTELTLAEHLHAALGGEHGKAALRLALDGMFTLVFHVSVATRFEQAICAMRAEGQALTPERLDALWQDCERAMYGDSIDRLGFLHYPHTLVARFYGYQYAYATLSALALAMVRREDPERFAAGYLAMLDATGSGPPAQLLARCGLDVDDPGLWSRSLAELDRLAELAW